MRTGHDPGAHVHTCLLGHSALHICLAPKYDVAWLMLTDPCHGCCLPVKQAVAGFLLFFVLAALGRGACRQCPHHSCKYTFYTLSLSCSLYATRQLLLALTAVSCVFFVLVKCGALTALPCSTWMCLLCLAPALFIACQQAGNMPISMLCWHVVVRMRWQHCASR